MKRLVTGLTAGALALSLAACGMTAQEACVDGFGPTAKVTGNGSDERFCMVNGQPVGEVEKPGFTGWKADD